MADQTQAEQSQSRDSATEGDKKKLFFGKYETLDAAESAFKEGERKMHEATQQAAQWKEIAEKRDQVQSEGDYGRGNSGSGYAPIRQDADAGQAAQVLARFYQDPIGVLREVKDTAAQEAEQRFVKRQREEAGNRDRVQSWVAKNPDLAQHGDLLDYHVRQTDGRLAVETRLDAAATKVRAKLVELRGTHTDATLDPASYVPGPSGNRDGSGGSTSQAAPVTVGAESLLAKYASERNANSKKRPGQHGRVV